MAYQTQSFPLLSFDQANPFLTGFGKSQDIGLKQRDMMAKDLANSLAAVQRDFAPRNAQAELDYKRAQTPFLESQTGLNEKKLQWYDPEMQSEIDLRRSQVPLNESQTGLNNKKIKWYDPEIRSEIALRKSQIPVNEAEAALKNFEINNPGLNQTGAAGQLAYAMYLDNQAKNGQGMPSPGATQVPQQASNIPSLQDMYQSLSQGSQGQRGGFNAAQQAMNQSQMIPQPPQQQIPQGSQAPAQNMSPSDLIRQSLIDNMNKQKATTELIAKQASGYDWDHMPSIARNNVLALAKGAGYTYDEANTLLSHNKSLPDLEEMKGFDRNDPSSWNPAKYPPTNATLTRQQRSNIGIAGVNAVDNFVTEKLAPYSQQWSNGMSLEMLQQVLTGKSKKEIGQAVGAAALAQEESMLRAAGGGVINMGIGMLRESLNASKNRLHIPSIMNDPEIYTEAQKTITTGLNMINKAENKKMDEFSESGDTINTSSSEGQNITKKIGNKIYKKINGDWYES